MYVGVLIGTSAPHNPVHNAAVVFLLLGLLLLFLLLPCLVPALPPLLRLPLPLPLPALLLLLPLLPPLLPLLGEASSSDPHEVPQPRHASVAVLDVSNVDGACWKIVEQNNVSITNVSHAEHKHRDRHDLF